jgi:hypothetical protein
MPTAASSRSRVPGEDSSFFQMALIRRIATNGVDVGGHDHFRQSIPMLRE